MLVGQQLEVETPHPRAAVKQLAPRLDGLRLERVEAIGKNLLLRFEGGLVLRSHLRMKGRWLVFAPRHDDLRPALARAARRRVRRAMFNGAVLELDRGIRDASVRTSSRSRRTRRDGRSGSARQTRRAVGDALLDQRLVAGIGNLWKAESLWRRARLAVARARRRDRTQSSARRSEQRTA